AIMLHVTTESHRQNEWGNILKSNSNGTYFSLSLPYVKRDDRGYVDFDKMQGIQGIALANIIKNPDEVNLGAEKQVASKITYNDGKLSDRVCFLTFQHTIYYCIFYLV